MHSFSVSRTSCSLCPRFKIICVSCVDINLIKESGFDIYLRMMWWNCSKCPAFTSILLKRKYEEVTFNGLTTFCVITHNNHHNLCAKTCRCFTNRSLKGGEWLAALSAGRLQERSGAAETGTGQEPANEERGRQHALTAAQLPPAGSAGHAEGSLNRHSFIRRRGFMSELMRSCSFLSISWF